MRGKPRWLQVVGWSGVGKTTVLELLVLRARERGESVEVLKLSHHALPPGRGDTGRLLARGAQGAAWWGKDAVLWQGSPPAWQEHLRHTGADWIFVEGGRLWPTPKVLLGTQTWPTYAPPVVATIGLGAPQTEHHLALPLPEAAEAAAAWLDDHRMACSAAPDVWMPLMLSEPPHD